MQCKMPTAHYLTFLPSTANTNFCGTKNYSFFMSTSKSKDPCKAAACKIQTCLREHSYDEVKCYDVIEDMRQCCLKWHKVSLCCSGIQLDRDYKAEKETILRERETARKSNAH
ncbi:cx9C motif-containing protein 4 [Anopheles funestus]|uniref:cx9C motif-containing protein 4 n=1 Tax=Anopheles funestus TaxID=62324 RepID=UPI0020C6D59E|nr:cx9C motif-containing protein 4 [Anopheles funestus]